MKALTFLVLALLPVLAQAAAQPLRIDSAQSRVEIVVQSTLDSFVGTLDAYRAEISVDAGRVTGAKISFNFKDLHTGNAGRDAAMHEWQNTPKHPEGVFILRALDPVSSGEFEARGTLTLHGIACELTFPITITSDQQRYAIDGEVPLDTRKFGLPIIRKYMMLKVDPIVKVRFHLQGSAKTAAAAIDPVP